MSAIFGVVGRASAAELNEMGSRLAHRGRLCRWQEVADGVYLGYVANEERTFITNGSVTAVVDGSAATEGIAPPGYVFERFVKDGIAGLEGGNAPFALAAWDDANRALVLARDFVGIKPLHYFSLPGFGVAFATEYKALLALSAFPVQPDLDAIQYVQCHKRMPGMRTMIRNIESVPPGSALRLDMHGTRVALERMRELVVDVHPIAEDQAREELGREILESARRLVEGHSKIGIALSGGIDSVGVAYACRHCAPEAELVGFTAGYGADDPEVRTAAVVMERLNGRHEPVVVTAETLALRLPEVVWYLENPVGRSETVQFLELGRVAQKQGFDWLMSGIWADNLFAGMARHKLLWLADIAAPIRKDLIEFYALTQSGRPPQRPIARAMDAMYFRNSVPRVPHVIGSEYVPPLPALAAPGPEFLNRCLVAGAHENGSRSLIRMERPLQASGIDFVAPFYDRHLMDYAFRLPSSLKIKRGKEKYILRSALRAVVPPELLDLPKFPMRMNYDESFADALDALCAEHLSKEKVEGRGFFRFEELQRVKSFRRNRRYSAEGGMRLWTAIATEIWAEQFLDSRGARPESLRS